MGRVSAPVKADFTAVSFADDGTALVTGNDGVVIQVTP